ncbi:MAG: ATP-binding protein, partial [Anaerolineae bacterium]|nr:ATP-binding protein [Anaerolineae bacterium]
MDSSTVPHSAEERSCYEDVHSLRVSSLRRLVAVGVAAGTAWFIFAGAILESRDLKLWSGPVALVFCSLLAHRWMSRWGLVAAAGAYVTGVAASVCLAAWALPGVPVLVLLGLPVGIASLLVGPGAGFAAAGGVVAALLASAILAPAAVPAPVRALTGVMAILMALLLWVAMYPLRMALHWAWVAYEQSRRQMTELRERRGELARTVKDLDSAYRRLESMAAELERARKAAEEARLLKAEFAAAVSHELRTPLNLIIGFSEMMAMAPQSYGGQVLPPAYRLDVQSIYYNAQHLSTLIDDVLDLSQIEAGRMGLCKEPLALAEVVAEATGAVSGLFEGKGLSLAIDVPLALPSVEADRTRVRQILINLLNNAARFTDQGGVTISARADRRDVTVSVADTGVGIAEEDIPRVFERFRQFDGAVQRRGGGSGLGLAISKKLVELHGGRMWLKSQLGAGTTFYFSLPIREELGIGHLPAGRATWARLPPTADGQRVVIVVGKDPAVAQVFRRYLDGYQVLVAADAEEARQLLAWTRPCALLLAGPSGEAGWLQLRQARRSMPDLPLILCSLQGGAEAATLAGVAGYLVKPITQERLLGALKALGGDVRSLLIVDDDPEVVRLLTRMVRQAPQPYRVLRAYGGSEALEMLRRHRPGAVVLDLLMPEVDGYRVLEEMRSDDQLRDVPAIVVTAKDPGNEVALTAELLGLTRRDGLAVGEMMRFLQAGPPARPGG